MFHVFESLGEPFPERAPEQPAPQLWAFLWTATAGLRAWLMALVVLRALNGAWEAALFALLGQAVQWLVGAPRGALWAHHGDDMLWLAALVAASPVLVGLQTLVKHQTLAAHLPTRLRWNIHRLVLDQSLSFHQDEFAGRVAAKVMQTAQAARDSWLTMVDLLAFTAVYLCTVMSVLGSFDAWLLLPFAVWMLLYAAVVRFFVPRLDATATAEAEGRATTTGRLADAYRHIKTVKLFAHGSRAAEPARSSMATLLGLSQRHLRLISSFECVNQAINASLLLAISALSLWLWDQGRIGPGAVAATIAMGLRLASLSHWLMWEAAALFEDVGTVRDGLGMLSRPSAVQDRQGADTLRVTRGEVRFHNVSFTYGDRQGGEDHLIDQLDLHVRAGERVGLVGLSGAGKSTLLNLLLRLHDLHGGSITVDGQDIAQVTQDSLRQQIGMLTQDTSLLHGSVRDNIVYGRPDATEAQLDAALRGAAADSFVSALRDDEGRRGLHAQVGECGAKLSGGQRQRIAIARVLLKDAPILLLDEATSSLDAQTESTVQASLDGLMEGKTVLAIAHRLSTLNAMDRLVVLERGKIVEQGDHYTLLARGGLYASLWEQQRAGKPADSAAAHGLIMPN